MDPKLVEVTQLFDRFKAAFKASNFDVCSTLLSQLKVRPPPSPPLPFRRVVRKARIFSRF